MIFLEFVLNLIDYFICQAIIDISVLFKIQN